METTDDMDDVLKKCEGISIDLPVSVEDIDIDVFDDIITLPFPLSAVNKSVSEVLPTYPLSAIVDIEKSSIQC